jgi:hypothetical protein
MPPHLELNCILSPGRFVSFIGNPLSEAFRFMESFYSNVRDAFPPSNRQ